MRATAALALLLTGPFVTRALGDLPPFERSDEYDRGAYGHRPSQSYVSTLITSPRFNLVINDARPDEAPRNGLLTFLAPHGYKIGKPGPLIVDGDGTLIWTNASYGTVFDFKVQNYKGRPFLTFWTGDNHVKGHGIGHYYMLDQSYQVFKKIEAGNGLEGDLHEFSITHDDRALITVYQRREVDLSSVHSSQSRAFIWDGLFQELDVETGKVVFQWRASDHISFAMTNRPRGREGSHSNPWDWFHINSVQKDEQGNYLVSSRYLHGLVYVSGRTGQVLWYLGGKHSNFTDLSHGGATDFAFQHDARWAGQSTITLFDNGVDYENPTRAACSRGLHLALDLVAMTVRRLAAYASPARHLAPSQGSLQILPNGNVLMGFGDLAAFAEFAPDGAVIRETHFAPASEFGRDNVQSYRVCKYPWQGRPSTRPDVAVRGAAVYASWNGATDVVEWVLEAGEVRHETIEGATLEDGWTASSQNEATSLGQQANNSHFYEIARAPKTGFETGIAFVEPSVAPLLRVSALDAEGHVLGSSRPLDWAYEKKLITRIQRRLDAAGVSLAHITLLAATLVVLVLALHRLARPLLLRSLALVQRNELLQRRPRWVMRQVVDPLIH